MDPATREQLLRDISSGSPKQRVLAIEAITKFAVDTKAAPHDDLVDLMTQRLAGEDRETDRDVREVLFDASRRIARRRAALRGVRVRKPDNPAIGAQDLVWQAIAFMWNVVSIYDGPEVLDAGMALATRGQRALYAMWWTQSEVRNGGFAQYFGNPTGVVAPYTVEGMRLVGATEIAGVVQAAIDVLNAPAIGDQRTRQVALGQLDRDAFAEAEAQFYALYPDMFQKAAAYIRAHPGEFYE